MMYNSKHSEGFCHLSRRNTDLQVIQRLELTTRTARTCLRMRIDVADIWLTKTQFKRRLAYIGVCTILCEADRQTLASGGLHDSRFADFFLTQKRVYQPFQAEHLFHSCCCTHEASVSLLKRVMLEKSHLVASMRRQQ